MKTAKFKDSELGPIPEDWEVKRLGDVCSLITKGTTPTSIGCQFVQNGITFVKAESISESGKIIKGMLAHIDAQTHRLLNRSILQEGDLLFSIAGVLGRVGRINNDILPANTNQALAIIRIGDDGNINRDYLFYCLKAQYVDDAIRNFSVGVAQANLSLEQVGRLQLAFPPLPEQRRIAEALGAVDRLIDSLDELIAKKRRIAQGFAHDLLGMRNDKNEPIRRLPGFKGEWERKRLGEIGEFIRGVSFTPSQVHSKRFADTIVLYRANNIQLGRLHHDEVVYVASECVSSNQFLRQGDILICAANGSRALVGKSAFIGVTNEKSTFGAFMMVFRCVQSCSGSFVGCFFQSNKYREAIDDILTGSAINNLNPSSVKTILISLPPTLAEQRAIAEVLAAADAEIAALEAKKRKYAQIKAGMMRDLLTGRVRVNFAASGEAQNPRGEAQNPSGKAQNSVNGEAQNPASGEAQSPSGEAQNPVNGAGHGWGRTCKKETWL